MLNIVNEIQRLKQQRKAVILAHNYQVDEVQEVADYVGDSFYLSKIAAQTECEVIVFCGVRFMAETAKILSPEKTVLLPESDAGCPLADMITADDLRAMKAQYPGVPVVCYINSSTEVKAESDACCTSSNAIKVVASMPGDKVIFVPDKNLGDYVAKKVPDKQVILWDGCCITHAKVRPADVHKVREMYPNAPILVHPECDPSIVELADFAGSTSEIIKEAENSEAKVIIIGTEMGVLSKLRQLCPDKQFYLLHSGLLCPNMKKTRLESVYEALKNNQHVIHVQRDVASKAERTLTRMLELA